MYAGDMTAIKVIKRLQQEWSDNSVSVTIYYRKEELDEIKTCLLSDKRAPVLPAPQRARICTGSVRGNHEKYEDELQGCANHLPRRVGHGRHQIQDCDNRACPA